MPFYDFDGEPIYVGQATEDFGTRIVDISEVSAATCFLAYRILDPFEVAEVEFSGGLPLARTHRQEERSAAFDCWVLRVRPCNRTVGELPPRHPQ